jgi:hypothetical protein
MTPQVQWPEGKKFAFTVFDDPDGDTVVSRKWVYPFLADLGFRSSIAVWPIGPLRERNSEGETCADTEYRDHLQRMQKLGFEIGYHNAAPHSCTREEVIRSLEVFREYFGNYPVSVANHYNADALYWGAARLHSKVRRGLYHVLTRGANRGSRFSGHVEGSPHFWGDICYERTRYFRNLAFRDINTLKACPYQPYYNPVRPYVREWFSASEGADCGTFVKTVSEANQDRLEEEGGMCIMYTHFGKGFAGDGKLDPEFSRLMKRLAAKPGWFAPTSTVLDHLRAQKGVHVISSGELAGMEWKWLAAKAFHGTS